MAANKIKPFARGIVHLLTVESVTSQNMLAKVASSKINTILLTTE